LAPSEIQASLVTVLLSLGPKSGPKKPVNGTLSYRFPERTLSQRARRN
jgi:hypothetical protein